MINGVFLSVSAKFLRIKIWLLILLSCYISQSFAFGGSSSPKGSPVFIQIFKSEAILELYQEVGNEYRLVRTFPICKFSGGLGPKRVQGDLKSPEGFYNATFGQLKPDSQYHRAINIGFPNEYDRQQGYSGSYLMIHGDCVSVGCYAMRDGPMQEIYEYTEAALLAGQTSVPIHIYPFKMTDTNLEKHKLSEHYPFWKQLAKGYKYFQKHKSPATVDIKNGQYAVNETQVPNLQLASNQTSKAFSQTAPNPREVVVNSTTNSIRQIEVPNQKDEANLLNSIRLAKENN